MIKIEPEVLDRIMIPVMSIVNTTICSIFLERGVSILLKEKYTWKRAFAFFCLCSALPPIFKSFF